MTSDSPGDITFVIIEVMMSFLRDNICSSSVLGPIRFWMVVMEFLVCWSGVNVDGGFFDGIGGEPFYPFCVCSFEE